VNSTSEPGAVYSTDEIARAAGVRAREVKTLAAAGVLRPLTPGYYAPADAITAVRALTSAGWGGERPMFRPAAGVFPRRPGMPIALSGSLHAAMLTAIALLTSLGMARTQAPAEARSGDLHMVFLVSPGPGGGGGGGGMKQAAPPPPAERKGVERLRSPVAVHHPVTRVAAEHRTPPPRVEPPPIVRPAEPPPVARADAMQPVFAPVVPAAPDPRDRAGLPWRAAPALERADSHGPGSGGGIGAGQGAGLGESAGTGIGPGSGGGTGGGPYRPGAGIAAPSIQREVRPDYTDEGRRRAIEGEVVLEIVVRADGSVGSVKLLQGLGAGLDQRAIDAVRQWRFNPAKRYGTPVDVMVEVSVEFRLR
jgi:TonB family protein